MSDADGVPPRALSGFRRRRLRERRQKETPNVKTKQCSGCLLWYPCIPDCFDIDRSTHSQLQSWCVECKDAWETRPSSIYRRMMEILERDEPSAAAAWRAAGGEVEFTKKYTKQCGVCFHCGAGLREWQKKGLTLDRIDNADKTLHTPQNTVLACFPCNIRRGSMHWDAWKKHARYLVDEHGWGHVPHGAENPRFGRIVYRRCRHLAVSQPQLELTL